MFSRLSEGNYEIYTINRNGKGLHQVTGSNTDTITPAWSPDGKLTFSRDGSIWMIGAAGTETRLTPGEGNDSSPAWRPSRR